MKELPLLPEPDAQGNYPALEYARASLARDIIRARVEAGLTQRELAKRAGIREETLCRIETGKNTPSVPTIEKIDRVLKNAERRKRKAGRTQLEELEDRADLKAAHKVRKEKEGLSLTAYRKKHDL